MNFKEISELIKLLKESNVAEFSIKKEDFRLKIKTDKCAQSVSVVTHPPMATNTPGVVPNPAPAMIPVSAPKANAEDSSAATPPASNAELLEIKSPIVGTFYRASTPEKPPFVKVGDKVQAGDVVCIVEAMKLFNEIESEISGTIVKVLLEDASPVEYDQPLFLVEK